MLKPLTSILITLSLTLVHAEETDEFIKKEDLPPQANQYVNLIINQELEYIRDRFNGNPHSLCDRKTLMEMFVYRLNGNVTKIADRLKAMVTASKTAHLFKTPQGDSIYHNIPEVQFCCISTLNLSGTPIGIDKIDHFFGNSGMLFEQWDKLDPQEKNDASVLQMAANQEEGAWGIAMTGIKSYGDLGANWSGFKFYRDLLGGQNPYFSCANNKLTLRRPFKIEDYFNKTWSESINCSAFKTQSMAKAFDQNLKSRGLTCPMRQEDCKQILDELHAEPVVQRAIISPTCFSNRKIEDSVEPPRHIEWTVLGQAAVATGIGGVFHYIMDRDKARGAK